MKEKKIKIKPFFLTGGPNVGYDDGKATMKIVGRLPKGGRVVLTLEDMPPTVVKQLVKEGLAILQERRDRALNDIKIVRNIAIQ